MTARKPAPISFQRLLSDGTTAVITLDADNMVSVGRAGDDPLVVPSHDACTLGMAMQEASRIAGQRRTRAANRAADARARRARKRLG